MIDVASLSCSLQRHAEVAGCRDGRGGAGCLAPRAVVDLEDENPELWVGARRHLGLALL